MSGPTPPYSPDDDPEAIYLRLAAQKALWGNVGPHVRSVYVGYSGGAVRFNALVDADLPEDEREALQEAATEVIADYPDPWQVRETITVDAQRPDGLWLVFERYRPV
jgi:hypothetical protein